MGEETEITQADRKRMGKRAASNDSQRRVSEASPTDTPVRAADVRTVRAALDDVLVESDDDGTAVWIRSDSLCAGPEQSVSNEIVRQVLEDIENRSIRRYGCLDPGEAKRLIDGLSVRLWSDPNQKVATYRVALNGEREYGQEGE